MSARAIGVVLAALLLLAAAWAGIVRMSWKEDATAVPAAGSAAGDVHAASAGSREPAVKAAGTAVAPTSGATANGRGGTSPPVAAAAPPSAAGPTAEATAPGRDGAHSAANGDQGSAGEGAGAAASTRYPSDLVGLQRAIGSVVPEMRECYAAWRKLRPGLAGAMRVHMTIEPDAKAKDEAHITRAEIVDDALGHAAVAGCVQNALGELSFEPPPEGKLDVVLPLQFAGPDATKANAVAKNAGGKPGLAASSAKERGR